MSSSPRSSLRSRPPGSRSLTCQQLDGWQAARIEEQLLVTADGCEVITRFPAEELMVAGREHYYTSSGQLPGVREIESHRNRKVPIAADAGAQQAIVPAGAGSDGDG